MKMKKMITILVCMTLLVATLSLSSCHILGDLMGAVQYPEVYSLTYEVTSADGLIHTVTKTVDKNGNIYYRDADTEAVYLREGSGFAKYIKNDFGTFEKTSDVKLTESAVESETAGICTYAEKSLHKFMPTAGQEANVEMLGRVCEVYRLGVGTESNSSYTYYFVDAETGICLGTEVRNTALGTSVPHQGEGFICTEFVVDHMIDVSHMIEK